MSGHRCRGPGTHICSRRHVTAAGALLAVGGLNPIDETSQPAAAPPRSALERARDYALTGGGAGVVLHRDQEAISWGDMGTRFDLKSTTKSVGVTLLGLALAEGKAALNDPAVRHFPEFATPPRSERQERRRSLVTLRMLADQTAGFPKPGGFHELVSEPGTEWCYSDGGPNWLADCLTLAYGRDLWEILRERVLAPLGIPPQEFEWRRNIYRPEQLRGIPRREFGAGILASVRAMARIGQLYLADGVWKGRRILPEGFVDTVRRTPPGAELLPVREPKTWGRASAHYSLLWWNNNDGEIERLPRDAYWGWGLYDSLLVVIPSLDLVACRAGGAWRRRPGGSHYEVLAPFLEPLAAAAR